jgi:hypothetical protein
MNVETGTAVQFPEEEYINEIFVAVQQKERVMLPGSVVYSNSEAKYILQGLLSRDPPANRQLFKNIFRFMWQLSKYYDSPANVAISTRFLISTANYS